MNPREKLLLLLVALAAGMAITRWFATQHGRAKRVRYDDPLRQLEADFPPEHREEAKALIESIAAHASPDDRALIWRRTVDAAGGDIGKLRRTTPKAIRALERIYRLTGGWSGDSTKDG
jgi:hypothetical protein